MHLSEELVLKVEEALAKAKGNRVEAAMLLERSTRQLADIIMDNPRLHRWMLPDAVPAPASESEIMQRSQPVVSDADLPLLAAVSREEDFFKQGLEGMNLTADQVKLAQAHQKITGFHFARMLEGMFGGMYSTYLQCIGEQQLTRERLANVRIALGDTDTFPYGSEMRDSLVAEEKSLAHQCRELGTEIIRVNEVGTKGAMLLSIVKRGKSGTKPAPRPAFKNITEVKSA